MGARVGLCRGACATALDDDGADDELPDDIEDRSKYVAVPSRRELGLGETLAMRFGNGYLPDDTEEIGSYFRRRGLCRVQGATRGETAAGDLVQVRSAEDEGDRAGVGRSGKRHDW